MSYGMVPPPPSLGTSSASVAGRKSLTNPNEKRVINKYMEKQYDDLAQNYTVSQAAAQKKKLNVVRDEYFEDDSGGEEEQYPEMSKNENNDKVDDDDEDDPLDAFMAEINAEAQKAEKESQQKEEIVAEKGEYEGGRTDRADIEQEDMQESYFKFMEEYQAKHENDDDDIYEYDEDGNVIWTWKKVIDPLPPVDHSAISYRPFNKILYHEHEDISNLAPKQVFELRFTLELRVYGRDVPKPVTSFAHFNFDKILMSQIRKSEFEKPTPIQAQAIPTALRGRDVLGLAKTGSGKTLAYLWPVIVHIMDQEELSPGEGPIALVVVPTRELALQVYQQALLYSRPYNINVVCAYGGGSKYEQQKALEEGAELVVCTPGRIIDMIKIEATNFHRTTFLVFDEVDRMFDLGFEPQVKSIADHIRPDRQCLMFSATMKKKVEKLAVHALNDPVKIECGDVGEANADVQQTVLVLQNIQAKHEWLFSRIIQLITMGKVLIFVTKKLDAEDLAKRLRQRDIDLVLLHGDMHQQERNEQITAFRAGKQVMVATDVAARGLDIPEIKNVINFDVARDIDTHVHRIGRTGRAGQQGFAYTLVTDKDTDFSANLVKNLECAGQVVPPDLVLVALKCPWFKKQLDEKCQGLGPMAAMGKQKLGLGFKPKERPGFGLPSFSGPSPIGSGGVGPLAGTSSAASTSAALAKPTISKTIDRAKSLANSGGVAGMNKMDMMRSALKGAYNHSFQRSTNESEPGQRLPASDPRPEWKIKLEERAQRINQAVLQQKDQTSSTDQTSPQQQTHGEVPKKRSRWA